MKLRDLLFAMGALLMTMTSVHAQPAPGVYVATYIDVRPESTRAGAQLLTQYERAVRSEAGNTSVSAFQEIDRSNRFVIIETWRDQAAFTAHEQAAATAEFRQKLKAIHNSPYDQRVNTGFAIDPQPQNAGSQTVYVVTHVDVPGAFKDKAEVLLKQLVEPSRKDAGHVRYDVYQQYDPRTNHFTVVAAWNNRRAFEASGGTPHAQQFREAIAPMLGALYDERLYQAIK